MTKQEMIAVFELMTAVACYAANDQMDQDRQARAAVRVAFDRMLLHRPWYERWADALLNRRRPAVHFQDEQPSIRDHALGGPPGYDPWTRKTWGQ